MPLSETEVLSAQEATNVGELVDNLERELFQSARYDDLEAAFREFLGANTAGTQIESRAHFYETRLPGLVTNYLITQHLEQGAELPWEESFSRLIVAVNPALEGEASCESLRQYLASESLKGRLLRDLLDEIVSTFQADEPDVK